MKKKISLELWLAVVFGGISQWLHSVFTEENRRNIITPLFKIVATVFLAVLTVVMCVKFYNGCKDRWGNDSSGDEFYHSQLSENICYYDSYWGDKPSHLVDERTGKKVLDKLDWAIVAEDGDSLVVYSRLGKRGYFNRFTGEKAVPEIYEAAWIFSDGVAAVCQGDSVWFIDHKGEPINGCKYRRCADHDYVYHYGLAVIPQGDMYGLVDKDGRWVLPAEYKALYMDYNKMVYQAMKGEMWGVFNSDGQEILPFEYIALDVNCNGSIAAALPDNSVKLFDYEGNVLEDFVISDISRLDYEVDEFDVHGDRRTALAPLMAYSTGYGKGLMDQDGNRLTPPVFSYVNAVTESVYECTLDGTTSDVVYVYSNGQLKKAE